MSFSAQKTKILILIPNLHCGGAERNVVGLCNHLPADQYDVVLAVLDNQNPFFRIENPAVKIIDLGCRRVLTSMGKIIQTAKAEKPDIILGTSNHLNLLLAIGRFFLPKASKLLFRETSIMSINSRRAKLPRLYNILLRIFYKRADMIICQSAYMKKDLILQYGIDEQKLKVIHNPVVQPEYQATASSPGQPAQFITVARLSEEKGIGRLLMVLSRLKIDFRYTVIGEGPAREALEHQIKANALSGKVFLVGASNHPYKVVPDAKLMLMGSYYEGFPNVLLEANAIGIPVVAYRSPGGIEELIVDGVNGFLVDDGNDQAYADGIQRALSHPFDKESIIQNTLQHFNPSQIYHQWVQIFETLISVATRK